MPAPSVPADDGASTVGASTAVQEHQPTPHFALHHAAFSAALTTSQHRTLQGVFADPVIPSTTGHQLGKRFLYADS